MKVGEGKVVLISGGGKTYTDIAARFVRGNKNIEDIIASEYDANIVNNIINSNHLAATEFDYYLFGIEGYSRACELHLVRKRHASYLIKSGRVEFKGKRRHDYVWPRSLNNLRTTFTLYNGEGDMEDDENVTTTIELNVDILTSMIEAMYNKGLDEGIPEEDLRYIKPQATEFKAIVGMNAHALMDFFRIRCCLNAQHEIRDIATKMLLLVKAEQPDLFKDAGPSCFHYGYCPENKYQNKACVNRFLTKDKALSILKQCKI